MWMETNSIVRLGLAAASVGAAMIIAVIIIFVGVIGKLPKKQTLLRLSTKVHLVKSSNAFYNTKQTPQSIDKLFSK